MMAEDERSIVEPESSSSSDLNPCPICLGLITQDSYLDQCFHKFCFNCIVQWTNIIASKHSCGPSSVKCPLCKVPRNSADNVKVSSYWKSCKYRLQYHWLHDWLRRETQAVTQEEDVDIIVHHILGVIGSMRRDEVKHSKISTEMKREEFKLLVSQAVRPFLMGRSDRFVYELDLFLASGLKIDAFDKVYIQHLGWKIPEISKEEEEPDETPELEPSVPYLYILDQDSDDN